MDSTVLTQEKNRGQYTRQVTNSPVWGGSAAFPTYTGRLYSASAHFEDVIVYRHRQI